MRAHLVVRAAVAALSISALAPAALANGILVTGPEGAFVEPVHTGPAPRPPARRGPVWLKAHRVNAVITGPTTDVTVEQTFHSDADVPLEGNYLFPLPEGAAVGRFAMTMGGKLVEGQVIEANEARRVYESIVSRRRDPGLLEYAGRGLFRARVFPIPPRSDLMVRLQFQQVLPDDAGTLEFRYPLATQRLNGQPVDEVLIDVRIDMSEGGADLKAVYSPSHTVDVVRDGERRARVVHERAGRSQDRDFLLYVGRSPDAVGFSVMSHKAAGEDGTFLAVLSPKAQASDADALPRDVVYVLDTSGSMAGEKMEQGRRAMRFGVTLLRPQDRFNLVTFSTGVNTFREGLVAATDETKRAALAFVDGLVAVGGTNIDGALEAALAAGEASRVAERPLHVVFVTDGLPTVGVRDPRAILSRIEKGNVAHARVFTFGVGYDLDVNLLDRIAEASGGARDYVEPGQDLEVVTGRFFKKIHSPVLSDVKVDFGPGVYDVYPPSIRDVFAGEQVVMFGRYREAGERTIRLAGKSGGGDAVREQKATFRTADGAGFLPRLWANRKVAYLLDQIRLHGENKELTDEVIRLATRFGIVTPYTAGLVVEDSELESAPGGRRLAEREAGGPGSIEDLRRRFGGGGAGRPFQGPGGAIPPSLREPGDPTRPPPAPAPMPVGQPPASSPPTPSILPPTTPAGGASGPAPDGAGGKAGGVADSKEIDRLKKGESAGEEAKDGLEGVRERVREVEGRTFVLKGVGAEARWVETSWTGKPEPTKVEAYSPAYFELLKKGDVVAKILALGERVVFLLEPGGVAYEIVPPAAPTPGK